MTDTFKDQLLHGMTLRESATDGSDFTNPAADYRRLYLGEDGQLHVKDSAGVVTTIGPTAETWDEIMADLAPVHRWKFDEASGNFADSGSVGTLTLAASGTITYAQAGPLGAASAALFATSANGLAGSIGSVPVGSSSRTIINLFKTNGDVTTSAAVWAYGTTGTARLWFAQKVNDTVTYQDSLAVWTDDMKIANRGTSDGNWHLVACGVSGGGDTLHFYLDGQMFVSRPSSSLNTGSTNKFKIPNDSGLSLYADEVAICASWVGKDELDRLWRSLAGLL